LKMNRGRSRKSLLDSGVNIKPTRYLSYKQFGEE